MAAAVMSTALPQLAYAATTSDGDDGEGVVDTVRSWFTGDDTDAPEPPSHDEAGIADRQKLPKGKNAPKAKRVKELSGRRSANARFWQLSDGRVQAEVSATPTGYRSGKSWKDIDTTVRESDRRGFEFSNTSNATRSWFGVDAERLLRVESADGHAVTVGLPQAGELRPVAEGDVVTYQDAVSGADLSYQVGPGRVKENIVLDRAPDGPLTFTFTPRCPRTVTPSRTSRSPSGLRAGARVRAEPVRCSCPGTLRRNTPRTGCRCRATRPSPASIGRRSVRSSRRWRKAAKRTCFVATFMPYV
ncbi:hypothetical protein [Streptomyces sp. NPDC006997]|uniref:hypothetical protein n=1 Tax=Streptomyces sp. NPDC006997 TaxID=3155356 RepID=UPI0033C5955A